jgi:hypothetical protein
MTTKERRTCADCGQLRTLGYFNTRSDGSFQERCNKCPAPADNSRLGKWHRKHSPHGTPFAESERTRRRWSKYKMNYWQFYELLASQGERCGICAEPLTSETACVDHDHECCPGQVTCGGCTRGLLCGHCNTGLGRFRDSTELLASAIKYLEGTQ